MTFSPMIDPTAQIAGDAIIGPGAIIGAQSVIGPGCVIEPYAIIGPYTTLGARCRVSSFASIGCAPQEKETSPDAKTTLIAGDDNLFREGCTISRGSLKGSGVTRIGSRCLFMAQSHVGHDSIIGDDVILSNNSSIAGHCILDDHAILGGYAGLHQFVHLGRLSFIAAGSMVSQDIPPFTLAEGNRAKLLGLNTKGLERASFPSNLRLELHRAFKAILSSPLRHEIALSYAKNSIPEIAELALFILNSPRGVPRILLKGE